MPHIGRNWSEWICWISLSNAHWAELTSVEEGIPHWFHTKMSQVAWGIIRDECPFPNEGSFICTSRQMYFFTNWQGCFGKQENANNKKCLKTMTTKSVDNVCSAGKLLSYRSHRSVKTLFEQFEKHNLNLTILHFLETLVF